MLIQLKLIVVLLPIVMSDRVITCKGHNEIVHSVNITACSVSESINVTEENVNITTISIQSDLGRNIKFDEISWFKIENQKIFYLPGNISTILSNLTRLTIKNSQLKKILPKNLIEFKNLTYLDLSGNEIQIIGPSLFEHNDKLEVLLLNNNRICYIHHDAFLALRNITILQVRDNRCYSGEAANFEQAMMLPGNTFCPLNITELKIEIRGLKTQIEHNESVFLKMILCLVMLIVIILAMFAFISYKLSSNSSSATQKKSKSHADKPSELTKPIFYGCNDYTSSNGTKLPEIIEVADEYDEINYMHYSPRISVAKINCEDFYAEPSIYGQQGTLKNDDEDSFVYSKV